MRSSDVELKMADEDAQSQSDHSARLGSTASQADTDSSKQSEKKKGKLRTAKALVCIVNYFF